MKQFIFAPVISLLTIIFIPKLLYADSLAELKKVTLERIEFKQEEINRLKESEKGVNGYAIFGKDVPSFLLTGDILKDQLYSTDSRIEVLKREISYLNRVLERIETLRGNLLSNGDFSQGLSGWSQESHGYRSTPGSRAKIIGPDYSNGLLRLGVYGGTHTVYQEISVSDLNLNLSARFRIQRWSTFGGRQGGWAAVGISYKGEGGRHLGSVYFYLNPYSDHESSPGVYWYKIGEALPVPTDWNDVDVNIKEAAESLLNIRPEEVTKVRISAIVFGTHEDGTYTIAEFDNFKITPAGLPGGKTPSGRNMVAYWRFDEGRGDIIHDSSGNNNNGLIHGADWVRGISGSALIFEGISDYIEVSHSSELNITDSITIEAWINQDLIDASDRTIIAKGPLSTDMSNYDLRIAKGKVRFLFRNAGDSWRAYSTLDQVITARSWFHVVVVQVWGKEGTPRIYINGVERPGTWIVGNSYERVIPNPYPLYISGTGRLKGFNGMIDEVLIWGRALSDEEIRARYERFALLLKPRTPGPSGIQNGLVAYFPFDGSAEDVSGHGYRGTEHGGIRYVPGVSGRAASFDGINDYIETNLIPPKVFTISLYYKAYNQKNYNPAIVSTYKYVKVSGYLGFYYSIIGGTERTWYDGNNFIEIAFTPSQWHHLVISSDGSHVTVYKDGIMIRKASGTITHRDILLIGSSRYSTSNPLDRMRNFYGLIDEVRIYSRVLSVAEISNLYNKIKRQSYKQGPAKHEVNIDRPGMD